MSYSPCRCSSLDCQECGESNRETLVRRVRGLAAYTFDCAGISPDSITVENAGAIEVELKPHGLARATEEYERGEAEKRLREIEKHLETRCFMNAARKVC